MLSIREGEHIISRYRLHNSVRKLPSTAMRGFSINVVNIGAAMHDAHKPSDLFSDQGVHRTSN